MTDPVVYLWPIPVLVGLGEVFPELEHWCNVIVSTAAALTVVGLTVYVVWMVWGPLPENRGDEGSAIMRRVDPEKVHRG